MNGIQLNEFIVKKAENKIESSNLKKFEIKKIT